MKKKILFILFYWIMEIQIIDVNNTNYLFKCSKDDTFQKILNENFNYNLSEISLLYKGLIINTIWTIKKFLDKYSSFDSEIYIIKKFQKYLITFNIFENQNIIKFTIEIPSNINNFDNLLNYLIEQKKIVSKNYEIVNPRKNFKLEDYNQGNIYIKYMTTVD